MRKVPLFMTRFSHAPQTAIGMQTGFLTQPFDERIEVYWSTPVHYPNGATMTRLENSLVARVGAFQRPGAASRLARRLRLNWWEGNALRPSRRKVVERLRERVSHVYLAPIDSEDSARMRHLVEILDRPFLVHLWDCLHGRLEDDPNLLWLARNAAKVSVLSRPLLDEMARLGIDAEILLFTRDPSVAQAVEPPREGEPIRVALLGLLDPYLDGVIALDAAIGGLAKRGVAVEPVFFGTEKAANRVNDRLVHKLVPSGFLPNEVRDARLATCHFGFVPGPSGSPESDMRSRYSIPSRSLDFLAVGLPSLGTVHPDSATGHFYRDLGLTEGVFLSGPEAVAEAIVRLAAPDAWQAERDRSAAAFRRLQEDPPPAKLRRAMDEIVSRTSLG